MADNTTTQSAAPATPAAGTVIATAAGNFSGDGVIVPLALLAKNTGAEGSRSFALVDPATEGGQDTQITHLVTLAGAVSGTGVNVSKINGVTPLMGAGNTGTGSPRVTIASDQAPIPVSVVSVTATAATPVLIEQLTNVAQVVVGSAKVLDSYHLFNPSAALVYVHFYDTTGAVTVGTTGPVYRVGIPAGGYVTLSDVNLTFASGIKVAATTTYNGSTAPATLLQCSFGYR